MAMGEALLTAAFQVALEKLASPILREFGSRFGIDKELKKLARTLSKVQAVLNHAEERQISDVAVQMWLNDLKDVAYDVDDVLDEVATEALRFNQETQVHNLYSMSKDFLFKLGLAPKIKEVAEKLVEIAKERDELGLEEGVGGKWIQTKERSQTSSLVDKSCVFGRWMDEKKIVEVLVSEKFVENDLDVIPIVGMGGLGKTTLAQLVYNEESVRRQFGLRLWVCVSENFSVRRLTKSIIESATRKTFDLLDLDILQNKLQDILRGKRFLILLDDMWSENHRDWDVLRLPFKAGAKGSKIIITTRSKKVASIMGTIPTYQLEGLSVGDCWLLFKQKAFADGNSDAYPNLVAIGKVIVKKCQGLPLAVKTLGSLLRSKRDEHEWDMILKSDIWELGDDDNEILPALRLSYNNLSAHLKQCFAYCSIFPKDYEFDKKKLVLLWIAEGFVHSKGRKCMEDVGFEYFDDLLLRSFFHHSKIDESKFLMHDLIHDLAQAVSRGVCFTMDGGKSCNISEKTRHASVMLHTSNSKALEVFYISKSLRTFMILSNKHMHRSFNVQVPQDLIISLRSLRVLDLSHVAIDILPDSVANLKHLRYLDLSDTYIKRLPESTCSLYNLQALILKNCIIQELPVDTKNLVNLRHLDVTGCLHLASMPLGIGKLTSLQTLNRFVADKDTGCGIGELKDMAQLRETLCIDGLWYAASAREAAEVNLKDKPYLHKLVLRWSIGRRLPERIDPEFLESLHPHTNLRGLKICDYDGINLPNWLGDSSLSHLVKIKLSCCIVCKILPPLGQLPSLQHLIIKGMRNLECINHELYGFGSIRGFPSLKTFRLYDNINLKEWHGIEDGEFPCLDELIIKNCPKLSTIPKLQCLHDLILDGCHAMVLSSVPYLTCLSSLKLLNFEELLSLPEGLLCSLTTLRELLVEHCNELVTLQNVGLHDHVSLQSLKIFCCPQLRSMTQGGLPTTLKHFLIGRCDNLMSLPDGLQNLSSLQELKISNCSSLNSLPDGLQNLSSISEICIHNCRLLASLPDEVLPATVRKLQIHKCYMLRRRCQEGGEDWHKIAHIPDIDMD